MGSLERGLYPGLHADWALCPQCWPRLGIRREEHPGCLDVMSSHVGMKTGWPRAFLEQFNLLMGTLSPEGQAGGFPRVLRSRGNHEALSPMPAERSVPGELWTWSRIGQVS